MSTKINPKRAERVVQRGLRREDVLKVRQPRPGARRQGTRSAAVRAAIQEA